MSQNTFRFKSLILRNFMSIGNCPQEIQLDGGDSVLIIGRNLDAQINGGSNGSGKTTLINGLCYVIFNKPYDNISLNRLINSTNANKHTLMEATLTFDKDGHEYVVYRTRGEDFKISVTRDGEDITPGKSVTETDKMVEDIIGISYDLFTMTVIFSGNAAPFLDRPIAAQRTHIEELFKISLLSEKAVVLKEHIKTTESDIKIAQAVYQQQLGAIAQHEQLVVDAENRLIRWDDKQVSMIADMKATLEELATVDIDGQQLLHSDRATLKQQLTHITSSITILKKDVKTYSSAVTKLTGEKEHLIEAKCPYCTQAFADAPARLIVIEDELIRQTELLSEAQESLGDAECEKINIDAQIKSITKQITHNDLSELLDARTNKTVFEQKIIEMESAENPHLEALERLVSVDAPEADINKVDALKKLLDHQNFLLKLLTDKNSFLRRRIINKSIPLLNSRLNHHTISIGLPHEVRFDADMSCTVSEFGRELDFGNLSAGEKKRVNTAMSLAFRDVLHQLHTNINLLMVDELDGALDQPGIDAIINVLKGKATHENISTFVISHHPSVQGRLDKTLVVTKENGFSSIDWE